MKKILLLSLIVFVATELFSQSPESRIRNLEDRFQQMDKEQYDTIKQTITLALEQFPTLVKDFEVLETQSDFTLLFARLNAAANPNNDSILGKSYTTFIKEEAKSILAVDLTGKAKQGFGKILEKITSIPIIGDIINTNPVAALASKVISSASNFLSQKIKGCAFCSKTLEYGEDVKQKRINDFVAKIQPYVNYYDKILAADRLFVQQHKLFNAKLKEKILEIEQIDESLNQIFNLTSGQSRVQQVQPLFTVSNNNYRSVVEKQSIISGYKTTSKYSEYKFLLDDYKKEFNKMFGIYLQSYAGALTDIKTYASNNNYDTVKIDTLINDINDFMIKYRIRTAGAAWLEGELGVFDNIDIFLNLSNDI